MVKIPEIRQIISIPENVEAKVDDGRIHIKGAKGELSKILSYPNVQIELKKGTIEVIRKLPRQKDKAIVGTIVSHVKNMIKGVTDGFEYKMKTVYSHFPIKTTVEENEFVIHNFLGERAPRKAKILDGVEIEVNNEDITVRGIDKEKVGQTVANIERATIVRYRDIRVFQDGVYMISKK